MPAVRRQPGMDFESAQHPGRGLGLRQPPPSNVPPGIEVPDNFAPNPDGGGTDEAPARAGFSSREVETFGDGSATPRRPMSPTPMAGSVGPTGPQTFSPLPGARPVQMVKPMGSALYGSMGGLQGGGLGLPLDPTSDQASDPIETLMKLLGGGRR